MEDTMIRATLRQMQEYMEEQGFRVCWETNDSESDQAYVDAYKSLEDIYEATLSQKHNARNQALTR